MADISLQQPIQSERDKGCLNVARRDLNCVTHLVTAESHLLQKELINIGYDEQSDRLALYSSLDQACGILHIKFAKQTFTVGFYGGNADE